MEWLGNVMKNAPPHCRFHWADIGAIKKHSHPTDNRARPKWPLASMAALAAEEEPFDFHLVDGRFRVASIAASMLHALLGGKRDALFGIHDYKKRRKRYGRVEDIGIIVSGAGIDASAKLAVLEMKPGLTAADIVAISSATSNDRPRNRGGGSGGGVCVCVFVVCVCPM